MTSPSHQPTNRLAWDQALAVLADRLSPIEGTRTLDLVDSPASACLGYILSHPVFSPIDVPGHRNSAVDGYAFCHAEYVDSGQLTLVNSPVAAGANPPPPLPPHTARRIFTGACVPPNADTILMQEDATLQGSTLRAKHLPDKGANLREVGEDTRRGAQIAAAGTPLTPFLLARLHASSIQTIQTYRPLRIKIFATGNEVIRLNDQEVNSGRNTGQVVDSNTPMLMALLAAAGMAAESAGHLLDTADEVQDSLVRVAAEADVILTTGGVSEGDADYVARTVEALGDLYFWRINIKPGRPLAVGAINSAIVIALPGNPIAAAVCLGLIGLPILRRLAGGCFQPPVPISVAAGFSERFKGNRREFLRASFHETLAPESHPDSDGQDKGGASDSTSQLQRCFRRPGDGSGLLTSLAETDGLLEIPEGVTEVRCGDTLGFYSYAALFSPWPYPQSNKDVC